ncbi:Tripartite motif-containing protein 75 [Cricetulus griseus]|uniref:Tripartite motif-containing protein 75 n=1 Tax=Cricetulus griseus TaxID=10029 RepID=G3ICI0_CRIGR|nr:Tripartite motif-containing protein 75 [Cricetulus griseus]
MSQMPKPQVLRSTAEEALCGIHLQPLHFFCDDEEITVCRKCVQSPEHMQHEVYGLQEAAEYYREEEQRFKEIVQAEYKMRFLLLTEQMELPSLRQPACTFEKDLKEAHENQLRKLSTELKLKSQKKLQVREYSGSYR